MSRQERIYAILVCVLTLVALSFAGREDYQAQLQIDEPIKVAEVRL